MMRTMLWKEYREHRLIWLTMMVVNCGALLSLLKMDNIIYTSRGGSKLEILGPIAALLVWGYGMVCGAMLLAGEREEGTLKFLDILPVSRFRLWLIKGQMGLLLLGGQIIGLYIFLAILRATDYPNLINGVDHPLPLWPYVLGMLGMGLVGLAYGLFFSARGENVLHTIGLAIIGQIIAWIASGFFFFAASILWLMFLSWVVGERHVGTIFEETGSVLGFSIFGVLTLAVTAGSARIFSREDRQRRPVAVRRMRGRASLVASWRRIVWLCYRQMYRLALGVLVFSLGLGILLLVIGPLLWPLATLLLGVLCGVTVFSDEQTLGSYRFLGDQRFPLGRIWVIKTGMRFALLLLASFLILLPFLLVGFYHGAVNQSEPPIIRDMPHLGLIVGLTSLPSFLLMWLLYGFCAGQLCGLLSRKSIVAAMIAFMISALLVTLWLPSLAGIGLHFWQVAWPPLFLLAAAAFLMRMWTADRLASSKTYLGVSAALTAALVWTAFGIWYRVIEIPDVPEPFNVADYTASLPTLDENKAGQLIRGFWSKVEAVMPELNNRRGQKPPLSVERNKVLKDGWPDGPSELGEWMDKVFAENWLQPLAPLPDLPLGMVVDPHLLTLHDWNKEFSKWRFTPDGFSSLLAARGLQQQARGDPSVFVEHMRVALALSRNLRHHWPALATLFTVGMAMPVATDWSGKVDLWLKKLHGRPDLLERALQTLIDHEAKLPDDEEGFRATYLIMRNTLMQAPEQLLDRVLDLDNRPNGSKERHEAELRTAVLLWLIPWEQERHQRLLHLAFQGDDREQRKILEWGGPPFASLTLFTQRRRIREPRERVNLRACQIKVALRLYQEENGGLPEDLDALVPRYLKSLPRDPFGGGVPFRYHRSGGEWIAWPETPPSAQQPGATDVPGVEVGGEVPMMPHADEQAAAVPPRPPQNGGNRGGPPAPLMAGGGAGAAPAPLMPDEVGDEPPLEGVPLMPHAEGSARPPLRPRIQPGFAAGGQGGAGVAVPEFRFVPKGQGILWSVGEVGQELIYLVPLPPD